MYEHDDLETLFLLEARRSGRDYGLHVEATAWEETHFLIITNANSFIIRVKNK